MAHGFYDDPVPNHITDILAATAKTTNHTLHHETRDLVNEYHIIFLNNHYSILWKCLSNVVNAKHAEIKVNKSEA